jgi:hypothetical protein
MSSPHSSPIKFVLAVTCAAAAVALILTQSHLSAQSAPTLGSAAQFALLGNSAVTGSAGSGTVVSGNVGSFPTGSISNFPPSTVTAGHILHTTANATVQQAQTDARAAYASLSALGGTPIAGDDLNITLTSGVYSLGAANLPASTNLTLNGSGIFIFNVASTLVMNASSAVIGTANPCNVYWRVGTSATLNGTSFMGTVLADASITLGGGNVTGRLLAGMGATGATTLSVGGNTVGGCSQATLVPTIAKAFSPTSILPGATSQLTITLTNGNSSSSSLTAAFTDSLPTGVVVAATPGVGTTCGGTASAAAGGSTVSLATSSLIPAGSCTITVNVTAAVPGSYLNTIPVGALQTSAGNNAVAANATLSVTCPVITLGPPVLPSGTVGAAYTQTITGSGGTAPYTFAVVSGTLPAGVVLSTAGVLSGTPTTAGTATFTIRGTDANNCTADLPGTIIIAAAPVPPGPCPVITLAPSPLPNGTVGAAYSQLITGSGGTAPYSFGVTVGTLPAGMTLTAAGLLAGTPTTVGSTTFTIRGTDAVGCFAEVVSTIIIAAAPVPPGPCPVITLSPTTIPNALVGSPFSQTLTASGGTAPYTFGVISGALPTGLTLTMVGGMGLLSGTPTTNGSYAFTIRATDSLGCLAERAYVVVVTTSVPTMPEIFLMLLAVLLTTIGYMHLRRA